MRASERKLVEQAKEALHARKALQMERTSRYLEAGSPVCCFLPSCRKPFSETCIRAIDGRFLLFARVRR
jgi:hypothetical protein